MKGHRMIPRRFAALGTVMLAAGVAGCTSTVAGQATEGRIVHGKTTPLWSPCTEIPDEILRGHKLDPVTKQVTTDSEKDEGW
ncbi:hypothetical protein [Nocardia sp. NPDC050793]|uniref:hypothetical protein n=1 Tax=Nocardia sp. NPDC050793 TaxID=3155159 RepID=UPI0033F6B18C